MRSVLTAALMIVATIALADEPSAPDTKAEATAPTEQANSQATTEKSATPAASTESTTAAVAQEDDKPFKPPTGYRPKRVNGDQVYCTKVVVLGSRFPKEDCRTEAQLRDLAIQKESMRNEMNQHQHACTSSAGCAVQ